MFSIIIKLDFGKKVSFLDRASENIIINLMLLKEILWKKECLKIISSSHLKMRWKKKTFSIGKNISSHGMYIRGKILAHFVKMLEFNRHIFESLNIN